MAVALRGFTQGARISGGAATLSWPAGTVAGDLALIHIGGASRAPDLASTDGGGWTPCGHKSWFRVLTSADVAVGGPAVTGSHAKLQTFSGAGGVGRTSSQNGLTTTVAGGGVWFDGARQSGTVAPSTYRLGTEFTDENGWTQGAYFIAAASAGWVAVPSASSGAEWYSYEILPLSAPAAPVLVAPLAGATLDGAKPATFSWQHQAQQPQVGFRLQMMRTSDSYTVWATAAGTWSTSDAVVASSQQSITMAIPPPVDQWRVQTQSAQGWSSWSPWRSMAVRSAPGFATPPGETNPLVISAPFGDLSPEVSWSSVSDVVAHRVRVTAAAATSPDHPLYDSGVIPNDVSPDVIPSSTPWTNGASMRAWVDIWDQYGLSSQASRTFTVSWTPPAAPTLTVAVGDPPVATVTGLTPGSPVQVEQKINGVWSVLATLTATTTSKALPSPLAMTGTVVEFRARQAGVVDGVALWSDWTPVQQVVTVPGGCVLVDDTDRTVYLRVKVREDANRGVVQGVSVTYGLGATRARVDRTVPAGERGTLLIGTNTLAELEALKAWLDARPVWWFLLCPSGGEPHRAIRAARVNASEWERFAQTSAVAMFDVPVSWVEQAE